MVEPLEVSAAKKCHRPSSPKQWQKLFDRHIEVLEEHLNIWLSVQSNQDVDSSDHETAQLCLDHTHNMIQSFQKLTTSFKSSDRTAFEAPTQTPHQAATGSSEPSSLAPESSEANSTTSLKRRRTTENAETGAKKTRGSKPQEKSSLFTIDPNPTAVEDLLSQKGPSKSSSRKAASKQATRSHSTKVLGDTSDTSGPPLRPDGHHAVADRTRPRSDETQPLGTTSSLHEEDSFVKKVKKRHQEKEEKRKKKSDKKRKRGSDASVDPGNTKDVEKPKKKKRKQGEDNAGAARDTSEKVVNTGTPSKRKEVTSNEERTKRRKKG